MFNFWRATSWTSQGRSFFSSLSSAFMTEKPPLGPIVSHYTSVPSSQISTVTLEGERRSVFNLCSGSQLSCGYEIIQPKCKVPLHQHEESEEVLHFISGSGEAIVDGEKFEIRPGTTVFIPRGKMHTFWSTSDEPLTLIFTFSPPQKLVVSNPSLSNSRSDE